MDAVRNDANTENGSLKSTDQVCYNNRKSTKAQRVYFRAYQDAEQIGKAKPRKPGEQAKLDSANRRRVEDYLEQKRLDDEFNYLEVD